MLAIRWGVGSSPASRGLVETSQACPTWPEIVGNQLELLKEITPLVSQVAVLWNPINQTVVLGEAKVAAHSLGLQLQAMEARGSDSFARAFAAMTREHAGALLVLTDGMFLLHVRRIVDLAAKSRLPVM